MLDVRLREEIGQLSWFTKMNRSPARWRRLWKAWRGLRLPDLPRRRREVGSVWGVTMVKDELDVLPDVLDHLFEQGLSHLLIADNRSTDGTRNFLQELNRKDRRVHLALDEEPAYYQSEKMTWLAHQAWRAGADWIVPFDADEFWFAKGMTVAEFVRRQDVGVVHAAFHHMVPTTPAPSPLRDAEFILDATPSWPGKVALRSHPLAVVVRGNHAAARVGGETDGLFIAHAQYRSPVQVARKVRQGTAAARLTGEDVSVLTPHWAIAEALRDDEVREVWEHISHGRPDARLGYKAVGPMLILHPLKWRTWDPECALN